MKKTKTLLLSMTIVAFNLCYSQVGIETVNPQGAFHIDPLNNNSTTGLPTEEQQSDDLIVTQTGKVGIGTTTPQAALDVNSNTGGIAVPRLTTVEMDSLILPIKSSIVYNTTTEQLNYNSGTAESPIWTRVEAAVGPPKEIHLIPQNTSYTITIPNGNLTFNNILSLKFDNYDRSLFSYNNPSNGRITILKKGLYELCARFGTVNNDTGVYFLHANINGASYRIMRNNVTVTNRLVRNKDCEAVNLTQDNNIVMLSSFATTTTPGTKNLHIYHISVRKIE